MKSKYGNNPLKVLIPLGLLGIVLAVVMYLVITNYLRSTIWDYHETMTEEEKVKYSSMCLIPELSDYCVRYGEKTINFKTKRIAVECCPIDELPEQYQKAAKEALDSEDFFNSSDIRNNSVKYYTIYTGTGSEWPMADINELPEEYQKLAGKVTKKYYQIMEYEDGSRVFVFWFEY